MANYSSEITITWGSQGQQPPSGYSYQEGEQPVDEWDNFMTFQLVDDVVNHLIPLTNNRLESTYTISLNNMPSNPENGEIVFVDNKDGGGDERISVYCEDQSDYRELMWRDGSEVMSGDLNLGGNNILDGRAAPQREIDPTAILQDAEGERRDVWVINSGDPIPSGASSTDIVFERE